MSFGAPVNLGPALNSRVFDGGPSISADGLSLYFVTDQGESATGGDIWLATRQSQSQPFRNAHDLGQPVNSAADEGGPDISADGLELFFDRGDGSLWVATRGSTMMAFGRPRRVAAGGHPDISADGLDLFFSTGAEGGFGGADLWVMSRPTRSDPFGSPRNLASVVNTRSNDEEPSISDDGLILFFASDRKGGLGNLDLWATTRASRSAAFGQPVNFGPKVNSFNNDETPEISSDGTTLYFMSNRPGGVGFFDLYAAESTG